MRLLTALAALAFALTMPIQSASGATHSWTFNLEPSKVQFQEAEGGGVRVAVAGYANFEYFEHPALPYRVVSILLPQGEDVSSWRLDVLGQSTLRPPKPLALFSGEYRDDGTKTGIVMDKASSIAADAVFPDAQVRYLGSGFYRGYRLATFAVYPIRYDAKAGSLAVETSVRLVVDTSPAPLPADAAERMRWVEGFREESRRDLARIVINPEDAASYSFNEVKVSSGTPAFLPTYEPSMEGSDVAYVIVTNEAMAPAFQTLADWKTKKGIPTVVRTVEWIQQNYRSGSDLAESVRNFIKDAYAKWGVQYVLLGGDTHVIPARLAYCSFYTGDFIPTDMYFSCLDGNWNADGDSLWGEAYQDAVHPGDNVDLYAEVYIGRMPVEALDQATTVVNKTMDYETSANVSSKKKFLLLGEVIFPVPYAPGDPIYLDGAEICESVYTNYLEGNPDVTTARLYESASSYPGSIQETRATTLDSMDAGYNHVIHVGHGGKYNMSVGDISIINYDANSLTNGKSLFSMYLMNCENVAFDTDCLAEYFLRNSKGGAFAVTGSSRAAFPSASRPYLDGYYRLLFHENVVQLGKLYTESRLPFTPNASGETADRWTHFIYNYLGDPEVCMFQGQVRTFAVTKPAAAHFGNNNIQIQVNSGGAPYDSAYVCLYKSGDDYVYGATDASGSITFNNFLCKSAGRIYVTVTGLDHARYSDTISVALQTPAYLRVSNKKIYDNIIGNNDGLLDAGEKVTLSVKIKNTGQTGATKLYARLRSASPGISVTDSVTTYPNIAAGAESYGIDAFVFSADTGLPDNRPVEFTIDIRDSTGGFWSEKFALDVHAPQLEIYVSTAKDTLPYGNNNGVIESGESFLYKVGVKNFGTGTAHGLTGRITSLDPDLTVIDGDAVYQDIPLLGIKYGDGFVLSEVNLSQVNYFQFELTDVYGRVFSKRMELRRPAAPTMLVLNSTYGPTEMQVTWRGPDTTKNRFQVYHSMASGGPYTLANKDLIYFTTYRDAGLLPSTRYYYVITAVDSCGNEGPRSVEKTATTSPPQMLGWPNKMGKETASSVRIADIDGDTHPDVVCGSDYIYAWHGNGIELRDGDGQPVTWGVFNTFGSNYTATVALANLDGVPGDEIIGASWSTNQIFIFNKNGAVLPGWPKSTTYFCWASPVVGDIDGDGALEIIAYDRGGIVYAWHVNGTEVRDGDNNPATNGPFFVMKNPGTWHISTPALADMDEDGVQDLIVCSPNDSIYCIKGNGRRVPGWPVKVLDSGSNITASPVVGDIDGDGHLEMVVPSSYGRVYCLRHDGSWEPGWPVWVYDNTSTIAPSAALADLDKDGKLEIVIAGMDKNCYIFRYTGAAFPGWPQPYSTSSTTESSPVVADINGDGNLEIILGCEEGKLNAWTTSGQYVAGFPIQISNFLRGTPMLADLDLDGNLELATSCWDQNVYVWDLAATVYHGALAWNGFHANVYNNGLKDFVPLTDANQLACTYQLVEGAVELDWTVASEPMSWNLYRREGAGSFQLIAARLRANSANVVSWVDQTAEEGVAYRYKLEADGETGLSLTTQEIMVPVRSANLYQNHPNPFNPSTSIPFTVPGGADVRQNVSVAVYDVSGALVKTLASGPVAGGRHEIRWDGRNDRGETVASGMYFVRMNTGGFAATKKMVLLR